MKWSQQCKWQNMKNVTWFSNIVEVKAHMEWINVLKYSFISINSKSPRHLNCTRSSPVLNLFMSTLKLRAESNGNIYISLSSDHCVACYTRTILYHLHCFVVIVQNKLHKLSLIVFNFFITFHCRFYHSLTHTLFVVPFVVYTTVICCNISENISF